MTPRDLRIRNATYRQFVELGRAPTPQEIAAATGERSDTVVDAWRRLHSAHALVLMDPRVDHPVLRMANPFSAVETPHRVDAKGRTWFANCAWDAFGIGVVLRSASTIHTTCPDCREPVDIDVSRYRPTDRSLTFHVLVPARDWWSDIGFT
jgi:hypothetical protein